MEIEKNQINNFKKYKGQIEKLYSDDRTVAGAMGARRPYVRPDTIKTREQLIKAVEDSLSNPLKAAEISETLLATNGIYNEIIQYYVNMPLYRYTVIPALTRKKKDGKDLSKSYADNYEKIIRAVDGISIEVIYPKILLFGLVYGIIYLYTGINKKTETIETFVLPNKYCKKGFGTSYGTDTVIFDFQFFTDMKSALASSGSSSEKIEEEDFLEMMPEDLVAMYKIYQKDPTKRFQTLDSRFGAAISFSLSGVPPKLFVNYGIVDYEKIKATEMVRLKNELEKILVHQVPHTTDGTLIFEIEEVLELHDVMAKAVNGSGVKLLTTFGKTDLIEMNAERTKENKTLQQAYDNVFYSTGLNPEIFRGESATAVKATIQKDAAYVFKMLNQITNFYNLAINNLFSFGPYEARINMLQITAYDEEAKVKLYRENANFGIGKLEAVIAAGIKQRDIADKHALEQYLNLDSILVPLQSTHTNTPDSIDKEDEENEPEVPEEPERDGTEEVDTK